jgi:hypothetical protein
VRDRRRGRWGNPKKLRNDRHRQFLIRLATHYRCTVAEIEARFSAYGLREMELAEQVVPYGEHAANLRARYLGFVMQAVFGGSRDAVTMANRINNQLQSIRPRKRRRNPVTALLGRITGRGKRQ